MDFMHDCLSNGRKFRTFNVIDDFNREVLNITIDNSISSKRVVRQLDQLIEWRGKPEFIRVDNGPEFIAQVLGQWCEDHQIELDFIQKGKPSQNGYVERFNRTYREDILDLYLFESLSQVRELTSEWMWSYNNERPHSSLADLPPTAFMLKNRKLYEFPIFQHDIDKHQKDELSLITTVAN